MTWVVGRALRICLFLISCVFPLQSPPPPPSHNQHGKSRISPEIKLCSSLAVKDLVTFSLPRLKVTDTLISTLSFHYGNSSSQSNCQLSANVNWSSSCAVSKVQWNPSLRTPIYNEQFRLSRRKALIFSLKLTRLIRTTDAFLFLESQTPISSTSLYGHCLFAHCPAMTEYLTNESLLETANKL